MTRIRRVWKKLSTLSVLMGSRDQIAEQFNELVDDYDDAQDQLDNAAEVISSLEARNADLRTEVGERRSEAVHYYNAWQGALKQRDELSAANEKLRTELDDTERQRDAATIHFKEFRAAWMEACAERDELRAKCEVTAAQHKEAFDLLSERNVLRNRNELLEQEHEQIQKDYLELRDRYDRLVEDYVDAKNDRDKFLGQKNAFKRLYEQVRQHRDELSEQYDALSEEHHEKIAAEETQAGDSACGGFTNEFFNSMLDEASKSENWDVPLGEPVTWQVDSKVWYDEGTLGMFSLPDPEPQDAEVRRAILQDRLNSLGYYETRVRRLSERLDKLSTENEVLRSENRNLRSQKPQQDGETPCP